MELQEKIDVFEANEIGLLAISVDPTATAKQMKERNNLTFPLLSDVNRETIKAYDVLNAAAEHCKAGCLCAGQRRRRRVEICRRRQG